MEKRGAPIKRLHEVVSLLANERSRYRLAAARIVSLESGARFWECHIGPDWLLNHTTWKVLRLHFIGQVHILICLNEVMKTNFCAAAESMKIERVTMFRQWQPFASGSYACSGGRSAAGFDSTIVRLEAGEGAAGWGEMAPLGSFDDPAFAAAAREGIKELAPKLLGLNPDRAVRGRAADGPGAQGRTRT